MTPKLRKRLLLGGSLILLLALAYPLYRTCIGHEAARKAEVLLEEFEGSSVSLFQLEFPDRGDGKKGKPLIQGYGPILRQKRLSQEMVEGFRSILTTAWTYSDTTFRCFDPGMALRFESGRRRLEMVICLGCARIRVWVNDEEQDGSWFLSSDGIERLYDQYRIYFPDPKPDKGS